MLIHYQLKASSEPESSYQTTESETPDVSLDEIKEVEAQENTDIKEDTEATNS